MAVEELAVSVVTAEARSAALFATVTVGPEINAVLPAAVEGVKDASHVTVTATKPAKFVTADRT